MPCMRVILKKKLLHGLTTVVPINYHHRHIHIIAIAIDPTTVDLTREELPTRQEVTTHEESQSYGTPMSMYSSTSLDVVSPALV